VRNPESIATHKETRKAPGRLKGIKDVASRCLLYLRKNRTTANSIRRLSSGQRSLLGSGGTLTKIVYDSVSVQIAKQKAGS
jgi:hypothetical protein